MMALARKIVSGNEEEDEAETVEEVFAQASEAASASKDAYEVLEEAYRKGRAAHERTRRLALQLGLVVAAVFVLLFISVFVTWRMFT